MDEDIDPALGRKRSGYHFIARIIMAKVGGNHQTVIARRSYHRQRLVECCLSTANTDDFRALGSEADHARLANARPRPGYNGDLSVQPTHHIHLFAFVG